MSLRYKLLGRSGLRVSELCLGALTFGDGESWYADTPTSRSIFESFASNGGNFIDTANLYAAGRSEETVGDLVRADRDHFVLATKYSFPSLLGDGDIMAAGNSRKAMRVSLEASLKRLKTDYIDLYWVHCWDQMTPIDEVLSGLHDLVAAGKVLYIGASNMPAWLVSRANLLAEERGWSPFTAMQIHYNLTKRDAEREFFPMARQLGLGIAAFSPLAQGVLSGKYTSGPKDVGRMNVMNRPIAPRDLEIANEVMQVAREIGCTPSQLAIAWLIQKSARHAPVIPIVGARTKAQLDDTLGAVNVKLNELHRARLEDVSTVDLGYPHDFLKTRARSLLVGGGNPDILETEWY